MKRFLILLSILFCNMVFADTINLHWKNYDGSTYQDSTCVVDSDLILPSTPPTRYGYTFTGWKLGNYIPIEYLESTGTQWINTGIKPTSNTKVKIIYLIKSLGYSGYIAMYGSKDGLNGAFLNWAQPWYINNVNNGINVPVDFNAKYTDVIYGTTWEHNGVSYSVSRVTANNNTMFLFGRNNGQTAERIGGLQVFSFQIYENNNLVQDLIPVLDNSNVPCMYDKVEGKFYYNQGTGDFIAGPVL